MLREIPVYLVVFAPPIFLFFAFMAWASFIDKLTAKPKPPARVFTPEEMAAIKAESLAMFAETQKSRLDYEAAHHH